MINRIKPWLWIVEDTAKFVASAIGVCLIGLGLFAWGLK